MNSLYSKKLIKHFKNPQNTGKIKNPSGQGSAGNLRCGDLMKLYLKISQDKKGRDIISRISFETFGCTVAVANTSLLTTIVKGKTLEKALAITKNDLVKRLGKIPPFKIHCSLLAIDALSEAIYDYLKKNNKSIPASLEKIHQRLEKDKKTIKEKYKNWSEK